MSAFELPQHGLLRASDECWDCERDRHDDCPRDHESPSTDYAEPSSGASQHDEADDDINKRKRDQQDAANDHGTILWPTC